MGSSIVNFLSVSVGVVGGLIGLLSAAPDLKAAVQKACMDYDFCAPYVCPNIEGKWKRLFHSGGQEITYTQTKCRIEGRLDTPGYIHKIEGVWSPTNDDFRNTVERYEIATNCTAKIKQHLIPGREKGGPKTYGFITDDPSRDCGMNPASDPGGKFVRIN